MVDNDFERLKRLREGERTVLAELYDGYTPLLYPVLVRLTGDRGAADEALMATWTRVAQEAGAYDPARGTVAAWLLQLARASARERIPAVQGARRSGSDRDRGGDIDDDPDDRPEHRQLAERVRRALGALEPKHRRVLESAFLDGQDESEIAARLGAPAPMVRAWARQALLRLREILPYDEWR